MGTEDKGANIHNISTAKRQMPKIITTCLRVTLRSLAII